MAATGSSSTRPRPSRARRSAPAGAPAAAAAAAAPEPRPTTPARPRHPAGPWRLRRTGSGPPSGQPEIAREHGGVGAVAGAQLARQGLEVKLDRHLLDGEIAGDFLVGLAVRDTGQHIAFARGQRDLRPVALRTVGVEEFVRLEYLAIENAARSEERRVGKEC